MFYLSNPYSSFPYCILSLVLRLVVVVVVVVVYDNEDDGVVIALYRQFSIMLCAGDV